MTGRDYSSARFERATAARAQRRRPLPRWARWLVVGVPLLVFLAGVGLLIEAVTYVSDAGKARGRVVDVRADSSGDGISYTPLIRYRDRDGRAHEAKTHISSSAYDYEIGARVDILYAADDPGVVRIDSIFSLYGPGLIIAGMGALFLVIASVAMRKMSPARPEGALEAAERQARETWRREAEGAGGAWGSKPVTTDPSVRGHAHKPKPRPEPTVRRMR